MAEAGHGLRRPWRLPVSLPVGHIRPTTLPEGRIRPTALARCVFTRRAAYSPRPLHRAGDGGRAAARGQRPRPACPCLPIPTSWRRLQAHSATAQQSVHAVRAVPGRGGAWEVRRTDSSSSFSCACRRRGARTLSFCRIAPSKSFDSIAAAEASPLASAANSARALVRRFSPRHSGKGK